MNTELQKDRVIEIRYILRILYMYVRSKKPRKRSVFFWLLFVVPLKTDGKVNQLM